MLDHVLGVSEELVIDQHGGNVAQSGGNVSSAEHQLAALISFGAGNDGLSIHSLLSSALLDGLVVEVVGLLHAVHHSKTVIRVVEKGAEFDLVSVALLLSMLAGEGGRVTSDNMSLSVRNDFQVNDVHDILSLGEGQQLVVGEIDAIRAEGLDQSLDLNLGCSEHTNGKKSEHSSKLHSTKKLLK